MVHRAKEARPDIDKGQVCGWNVDYRQAGVGKWEWERGEWRSTKEEGCIYLSWVSGAGESKKMGRDQSEVSFRFLLLKW